MRTLALIKKVMAAETGVPDYSDPMVTRWRNAKGELHRDFGPARVWSDGATEWYRHGKLHREGGPASENIDGTKAWWRDGQLHREDGPAVVKADGTQYWWRNGELHREDGPAVVQANGTRMWYRNGVLHRDDGPAFVTANGALEYRNGKRIPGKTEYAQTGLASEHPKMYTSVTPSLDRTNDPAQDS